MAIINKINGVKDVSISKFDWVAKALINKINWVEFLSLIYDISTANSPLEFNTRNSAFSSAFKIDTNHFINFWRGIDGDWFAQTFEVNTNTWVVTTVSTTLEFDTQLSYYNSCCQIDSNHFVNFWLWLLGNAYTQVFEVNTSTWAITTSWASLKFDWSNNWVWTYHACHIIDSNHVINVWRGWVTGWNDWVAQVFEINTSTWAITTAWASFKFDWTDDNFMNTIKNIDENHFIVCYTNQTDTDWKVVILEINTSTWAVTTTSILVHNWNWWAYNSMSEIDSNHFIDFYSTWWTIWSYAQVFEVNTSTWAVTTASERFKIDTQNNTYNSAFKIDTNHFINYWRGIDGDWFAQTFEVNTNTWVVTTVSTTLEFDTQNNAFNSAFKIDTTHYINFWTGAGDDWFVQVFTVT